MRRILAVFLMVVLVSGCAAEHNQMNGDIETDQNAASNANEVEVGRQIHQTIMSSFNAYTDPVVLEYVTRVGNQLAEQAERKDLTYHFTILYSEKIYATSAPGGYIYITTGFLHFLDNESELAAVLGHEIGQLQFRDSRLKNSTKTLEKVTKVASMVAPAFGQIGMLAILGLVVLNASSEIGKPSPEAKLWKADEKAMKYMVQANYDPQGMVDLLHKFVDADDNVTRAFYDYYRARPITKERMDHLKKTFSELPLEDKSFSTNRKIYQDTIKGVNQIYQA